MSVSNTAETAEGLPPRSGHLGDLPNVAHRLVDPSELAARLGEGRPLTVKVGVDPTGDELHLGHLAVLRTAERFQDEGHDVVVVIGGMTAQIGDPSGRDRERPLLDAATVDRNASALADQVRRVFANPPRIVDNREWFDAMTVPSLLRVARDISATKLVARRDLRDRLEAGGTVRTDELLFPLLQAHDSVQLEADVEVGGQDQLLNLLLARDLQERHGQRPQVAITVPLLPGTNGQKMSKSADNHVPVTAEPDEQFGRLMSFDDDATFLIAALVACLGPGEQVSLRHRHPADAKRDVAETVVADIHGSDRATAARQRFDARFRDGQIPEGIPEIVVGDGKHTVVDLLVAAGLADSRGDARRVTAQGGVRLDRQRITDLHALLPREDVRDRVLSRGRRRHVRLL